ncbi:MAG: hypothetical protein VX619_02210 [bacterium]|nr:hypothetical protein [bacterium]
MIKSIIGFLGILGLTWLLYSNNYFFYETDYLDLSGKKLEVLPKGPHSEDYVFDPKKYTLFIRWEFWSPESMMSISGNNIIFKNLSEKINIIGICSQWDDGIKEIKKARISFPLMFDQNMTIDRLFNNKQIPFYVLIDTQREIIWQGSSITHKRLSEIIFSYQRR